MEKDKIENMTFEERLQIIYDQLTWIKKSNMSESKKFHDKSLLELDLYVVQRKFFCEKWLLATKGIDFKTYFENKKDIAPKAKLQELHEELAWIQTSDLSVNDKFLAKSIVEQEIDDTTKEIEKKKDHNPL